MSSPQAYVKPVTPNQFPKGLTLTQFIQTVLTGVSGLDGTLCRPDWQIAPPKQPDILTDWIGFGVTTLTPDANSWVDYSASNEVASQRHEKLEVTCQIYGPNCIDTANLMRDGFQIQTNLQALLLANMGFVEVSQIQHVPDLVNERFVDRVIMKVFLRREIQRTYPVLTIVSANGTIYVPDVTPDYSFAWEVDS